MRLSSVILVITTVLFSCENSDSKEENTAFIEQAPVLYGEETYNFPELLKLANEQVVHWGVLEDLISEIKDLNGSNYIQLRTRSENVKEYSDSLANSIPETLNTNPINSRLLVLKTRAALLYETAHLTAVDTANLQNAVAELNVAVNNLVMHFNEKVQKDRIDLQRKQNETRELEKQTRFRDSVIELEFRNLNKS